MCIDLDFSIKQIKPSCIFFVCAHMSSILHFPWDLSFLFCWGLNCSKAKEEGRKSFQTEVSINYQEVKTCILSEM